MTRTAWLAGLVACLVAAPALAQQPEPSPGERLLAVETLPPEPTVVITADRMTQRYRVRFRNLLSEGKEIVVLEDRMVPEHLAVAPFEALALEVEKHDIGDEHIWEFVYAFRVINPVKQNQVLPSFSFYWLVRDLGQPIEEAEVQRYETDPVTIRYVSTITDEPQLDIRDTIYLGDFSAHARLFNLIAWFVAPLPLLLCTVALIRVVRGAKREATVRKAATQQPAALAAVVPDPPTLAQARRNLRRQIAVIAAGPNGHDRLPIERDLVISFREYLMAELPQLNPGDTARDIRRYVETSVPEGSRKTALSAITSRLLAYQSMLERGEVTPEDQAISDARVVASSLDRLQPHVQLLNRIREAVGRPNDTP